MYKNQQNSFILSGPIGSGAGGGGTPIPPEPHAVDSAFLLGNQDVDVLVANLEDGQAFHFHSGGAVLTSAEPFVIAVDGLIAAAAVPEPLTIPVGVQGYLSRNALGVVTVSYTTVPVVETLLAGRLIQEEAGLTVSNVGGPRTISFTPAVDGDVTIRYFAGSITGGTAPTGGIAIRDESGTDITGTNLEGYTFANEATGRLAVDNLDRTITLPNLNGGETYEIDRWGGGGTTLTDYQLDIRAVVGATGDTNTIVTNSTGFFRLSRHEDKGASIPGTIETGHDLTQANGLTLRLFIRDQASNRGWQIIEVDVDNILEIQNDGTNDGFGLLFDNDFITFNIIDAVTGTIALTESGRDFEYGWSELWISAPTNSGVQEVLNLDLAADATTGTFQNLGDPNELFTGSDGDRVHIEYGDGNRDVVAFLDGIAREERQGFSGSDLVVQVVAGGQLQIRDAGQASGISRIWYEWKDGVVRTTKSVVSSDCTLKISDEGSSQDISLDTAGVEYFNRVRRASEVLVFAKEGTSSHSVTVQRYMSSLDVLEDVTYDNLLNANDLGGGVLQLTAGVNSNFNRRASSVETIWSTGDYFEFTVSGFSNEFAQTFVALTKDATLNLSAAPDTSNPLGVYRLRFFNAGAAYELYNPLDEIVANGPRGTFRLLPTFYGIKLLVDGVSVYETKSLQPGDTVLEGTVVVSDDGRTYVSVADTVMPTSFPNVDFIEYVSPGIRRIIDNNIRSQYIPVLGQSWATVQPPSNIDADNSLKLSDGTTNAIDWCLDGITSNIGGNRSAIAYGIVQEYLKVNDVVHYCFGVQRGGARFFNFNPTYDGDPAATNNTVALYPSLEANWNSVKAKLGFTPEITDIYVHIGAGDEANLTNFVDVAIEYAHTMQAIRELYEAPDARFIFMETYQGISPIPYGEPEVLDGLAVGGRPTRERQAATLLHLASQYDARAMVIKNAQVDGIISDDTDPPIPADSQFYSEKSQANVDLARATLSEGETFVMGEAGEALLYIVDDNATVVDGDSFDGARDARDGLHHSREGMVRIGQSFAWAALGDLSQLSFPPSTLYMVANEDSDRLQRIRMLKNSDRCVVGVTSPVIGAGPDTQKQYLELPSPRTHRGGDVLLMMRNTEDLVNLKIEGGLNRNLFEGINIETFESSERVIPANTGELELRGPLIVRFVAHPSRNRWQYIVEEETLRSSEHRSLNILHEFTGATLPPVGEVILETHTIGDGANPLQLKRQGRYRAQFTARATNIDNPVTFILRMTGVNNNWEKRVTAGENEYVSIDSMQFMDNGDEVTIAIDHDETTEFFIRNTFFQIDKD